MRVFGRIGLGFMLNSPEIPMGPNPHPFGHPGAGGSLGFADPDAKLGFGYVMNQMGASVGLDPRPRRLIDAAYASL
jgi:CubicO group peptidase (beta-lactamase class C family)